MVLSFLFLSTQTYDGFCRLMSGYQRYLSCYYIFVLLREICATSPNGCLRDRSYGWKEVGTKLRTDGHAMAFRPGRARETWKRYP